MNALGGLTILTTTPAAFIVSLIGVIRSSGRPAAIAGLIISGALMTFLLGGMVIALCVR